MKFDVFEVEEVKKGVFSLLHNNKLSKKIFGQIYAVIIQSGEVRGNHYHKKKEEWAWVISGKAAFTIGNKKTKEKERVLLDGKQKPLKGIRISPGVPHAVKNIGGEPVIMIEYSTHPFQPNEEDQYSYKIE